MLDTNTVSAIIKSEPTVQKSLKHIPLAQLCISTITEAELLYGVAKIPDAKQLPQAVREFLLRVDILDWDSTAANSYAHLRVVCNNEGKALSAMDMLIAAHSMSVDATLVSNDRAFYQLKHHIHLENWSVK